MFPRIRIFHLRLDEINDLEIQKVISNDYFLCLTYALYLNLTLLNSLNGLKNFIIYQFDTDSEILLQKQNNKYNIAKTELEFWVSAEEMKNKDIIILSIINHEIPRNCIELREFKEYTEDEFTEINNIIGALLNNE